MQKILEATQFIQSKILSQPTIGIILGSSLGSLADEIKQAFIIPYDEIPHFAKSNAIGHAN